MLQVTLDLSVEKVKALILQLPAQELLMLVDAIEERVETVAMMQLAKTGFEEWNKEGEDVYDA
ncbi:TPA: hypothetical protein DIT45_02810 [Candidatus Acetothermia bacterium]|nr:hypothetical protein [Candidatus Acetothermia bacterium]